MAKYLSSSLGTIRMSSVTKSEKIKESFEKVTKLSFFFPDVIFSNFHCFWRFILISGSKEIGFSESIECL